MAIEVYNVVLNSEHIIGVGPLVRTVKADPVSIAHKELRLQFDLYLVNYRMTITTDVLAFGGTDKTASDAEAVKIRTVWERLRTNLANNYPIETGFGEIEDNAGETMPGV